MAKFTEEIPGVDTRFVRSQPGITDTSTAESIKGFGELGVDLFTSAKKSQVERGLEGLKQDFLDETVQYTTDEIAGIQDFQKRFDKLKQMSQASGQVDRFRIRAEAMLKQHINAMPGLQREFRQAAAGVLGFDPTGEAVRQQMEQIEKESLDSRAMLEQMDKDSQTSFGFVPGEIYTDRGQKRYMIFSSLRDATEENQALAALKESFPEDVKLSPGEQLVRLTPKYATLAAVDSETILKQSMKTFGVSDSVIQGNWMDVDVLNLMNNDQIEAVKLSVQQARDNQSNQLFTVRGDLDQSTYDGVEKRILKPYDDMLAVLNGEKALADVKARNNLITAAATEQLQDDPNFQQLLTWAENFQGIEPPATWTAKTINNFVSLSKGVFSGGITQRDVDGLDKESISQYGSMMKDAMAQAFSDEGTDTMKNESVDAFMNFVDMFDSGLSYKQSVVDELVNQLSKPEMVDVLNKSVEYNPEIGRVVQGVLQTHTRKLSTTAKRRFGEVFSSDDPVDMEIVDGRVVINLNADALRGQEEGALTPGRIQALEARRQRLKKEISRFNSTTLNPLNKAVEAISTLSGKEKGDIIGGFVGATPAVEQPIKERLDESKLPPATKAAVERARAAGLSENDIQALVVNAQGIDVLKEEE